MTEMVCALMLMMPAAPAQQPPGSVTLDQAIAEALTAEPRLKAARAELEVARGERRQAEARPNPEVMFEQREQAGGADRQTALAIDIPLDLFRRGPRIEVGDRTIARTAVMIQDGERLLAAAVRERYGEVLVATRRLEVIEAVVAAASRTHELLAGRVAEGAAPPLDRDLALVELRRMEGARALETGRVAAALSALKVLLGRAPETSLTLSDTLERLVPPATNAVAAASAERPDVRAAAADLDLARAQTTLARQDRKPELRVFGGYMRMDQGFPQSGIAPDGSVTPIHGVFHTVTAGVKIGLPILNRGDGAIAAAEARETAAAHTLAGRRLAAAGEVDAAQARLAAARQALAAYGDGTRTLARRNLDVIRESYSLGRVTLLDVLNEQRRYLDFETAHAAAVEEAVAAIAELQRAKGGLQ